MGKVSTVRLYRTRVGAQLSVRTLLQRSSTFTPAGVNLLGIQRCVVIGPRASPPLGVVLFRLDVSNTRHSCTICTNVSIITDDIWKEILKPPGEGFRGYEHFFPYFFFHSLLWRTYWVRCVVLRSRTLADLHTVPVQKARVPEAR
jgi:hypothetical protein